jgi:hypothetical protein
VTTYTLITPCLPCCAEQRGNLLMFLRPEKKPPLIKGRGDFCVQKPTVYETRSIIREFKELAGAEFPARMTAKGR